MTEIQNNDVAHEPISDMAFFVEYIIKNRNHEWLCRNGKKAIPCWERFKIAEKFSDRAGVGVLEEIPFTLSANILVFNPETASNDIERITFEHTTMRANIIIQDGDQAINLVSQPNLQSEWDIVGLFKPEVHQQFKNAENRYLNKKNAAQFKQPKKPKTRRMHVALETLKVGEWGIISGTLNESKKDDFITDNLFLLRRKDKIQIKSFTHPACAAIAVCENEHDEILLTSNDLKNIQVVVEVVIDAGLQF